VRQFVQRCRVPTGQCLPGFAGCLGIRMFGHVRLLSSL
jgi:hypothetical protein